MPPEALGHDPSGATPLLLRALRGEPVRRPPVWFMRQAGRFLPEYRAVRDRTSFLELCHDAELACEVTLQPLRRFAFDAGIIFSDILLPLEAMGKRLVFGKGHGPEFPDPVRTLADVRALRAIDPARDLPAPLEALRLCNARAGVPVLGFAGAPFTLACYLVEGGGSKEWLETKRMMWQSPLVFSELLTRLAEAVGDHLQAQVEAGAPAVQLFDTWAGALDADAYRRWAAPAARRAIEMVRGAVRIYYTRDAGPFLPWLRDTGADAFGLDWRVDLTWARQILGDVPLQGNLDPIALFAPPDDIRSMVQAIIESAGPRNHVFNLGHGITPSTPIEGVAAAVDAVREWSWS